MELTATDLRPDDHVYGSPEAPVTLLEYGDFECPYCAAAAPVLTKLVDESDGGVKLVFRNYPLPDLHPYALTAALAAEAAADQGAYWPMHHKLFLQQDRLTDSDLRTMAESLGLDASRVVGAAAQRYGDKVEADFASGVAAGVPGTPTLFVDGALFQGRPDMAGLRRAVSGRRSDVPAGDGGGEPGPRRKRWWRVGAR